MIMKTVEFKKGQSVVVTTKNGKVKRYYFKC